MYMSVYSPFASISLYYILQLCQQLYETSHVRLVISLIISDTSIELV